MSREAGLLAATALATVAAGVALGYRELVAAGLALALTLVVAAAFVARAPRLAVVRGPAAVRGREGEPLTVTVGVVNQGRHRTAGLTVTDGPEHDPVELAVPPLAPGARHDARYELPAPRRGRYRLGPVRVVRADPLGLLVHRRPAGGAQTLWVHPRTDAAPAGPGGADPATDRTVTARVGVAAGGSVPGGVRPYRPGDDVRSVHWPSSIRRDEQLGRLMVREPAPERRTVVVLVDTAAASHGTGRRSGGVHVFDADVFDADVFDAAVRLAASVVVDALAGDRHVELRTTAGLAVTVEPGRRGRTEALDRLAELVPDDGGDGAGGAAPLRRRLTFVTGPTGDRRRIPAGRGRGAVRVLRPVVP